MIVNLESGSRKGVKIESSKVRETSLGDVKPTLTFGAAIAIAGNQFSLLYVRFG